jgi:hypothetical protein
MIPLAHVDRLLSMIWGWIEEGGSQSAGMELTDLGPVRLAATV